MRVTICRVILGALALTISATSMTTPAEARRSHAYCHARNVAKGARYAVVFIERHEPSATVQAQQSSAVCGTLPCLVRANFAR
ncbi:hypothetical protein RZS28_02795 [Methylocapsa polymorpha]|uniref:Secreted protein n=1 Tax=Methylocapsa polymorpha TaxID=3080828 RepID=A0ABZ0HSF9_9HYPH|nr:hypothetical protein RZS28_02795 [Methylocapsa sp. RX1]